MESSTKFDNPSNSQDISNTRLIFGDWERTYQELNLDLEGSARQARALLRRRGIRLASDLLRLVLMYAQSDCSLRWLGAWALLQGIGYLSDVALLKRLRRTGPWLGRLIGLLLERRCKAFRAMHGVRLRLEDASTLCCPGSHGSDYRLHLSVNLWPLAIDGIGITDAKGAETLARFAPQQNEIRIADRGYAYTRSLTALLPVDSPLVVRINWQNLPLQTETGQRFNLIDWLKTLAAPGEQLVWLPTPQGCFPLRLLACPLPPEAVERARQRAWKNNHKKGHTPSQATLLAAGFPLLVTNLPGKTWPIQQVVWLYRLRWQIELVFKRLKSLIQIDHLRVQDPQMVQVYLFAKLLTALIIDGLNHQVDLHQPEWFLSLERPVSLWRLTQFFWQSFRQVVAGRLDWARFWTCLPALRRYFCDSPRGRPQSLAWARAFLDYVNGSFSFFSCKSSVYAC
jgi:hypothetical protein